MRKYLILAVALAALLAAAPALAITGGQEDTANDFDNVALLVFFEVDGEAVATPRAGCAADQLGDNQRPEDLGDVVDCGADC